MDNFETKGPEQLETGGLELRVIIAHKHFRNAENGDPLMEFSCNGNGLLILHSIQLMEFGKMIFDMEDPVVFPIGIKPHIDKAYLHPLEQTLGDSTDQRATTFALVFGTANSTMAKELDNLL